MRRTADHNPELALGTVRFSEVDVRILELPASQGVRLDGLVGLDLLRRMPVTIDFRTQTIQFGTVPPLRHSQSFYPRFPFIPLNLTVNGEVLRVVVDTGAVGLMLYGKAIRDRFQFPRNGSTETWPYAGGRVKMDPVLVQGLAIGETACGDLTARVIRDGKSGNRQVMGNLGIQSLGLAAIQLDLQAGHLGWEE